MAWFLEAEHDGESIYPALYEAADDPETHKRDNVRFDILRHFGAFVTESSNHMSEYVPYFRTDEAKIEEYTVDEEFDDYFVDWMPTGRYFEHWCEYQQEAREMTADDIDPEIERSEEYGSRIIHSMETGEQRRMNINVRNDAGAIANLGNDTCVEVPCSVDGQGPPRSVGELPPGVGGAQPGRTPASSASRCRRPPRPRPGCAPPGGETGPADLGSVYARRDRRDGRRPALGERGVPSDELVEETRTASSPA